MTLLREAAEIAHDVASICGAEMQQKLRRQVQDIRGGVVGLMFRLAFLKIGLLLVAAGTGFVLWGVYRLIALSLNPAASALILGGSILLIGLLLCWVIKRMIH